MEEKLRVMVVDDHPMWREGVARDLTEAGMDVVATASDGTEALTRFAAAKPHVLVLDLQIPEPNGVAVTAEVIRQNPAVRVLILSADIGEGHDLPARALAMQLRRESPGVHVGVVDGLQAMGQLLTLVIRDGSWLAFNWLPWLFEAQYFLAARFPPTRWLTLRLGCLLGARGLRKTIRTEPFTVVARTGPKMSLSSIDPFTASQEIELPKPVARTFPLHVSSRACVSVGRCSS